MSRKDEFQKQNPNPATRFLEWKSDEKAFQYYDKEAETNKIVSLPLKFITLKEMHAVKGWSNASESGIYSNEVQFIGKEILNVRSFKGGEIAQGLWKDIKNRIKDFGGKYVRSVYIMTEQGEIWNLQLKGTAASAWYEFTAKTKSRLFDEWVEVVNAEECTNGNITYYKPTFQFNTSLTNSEADKAEEVYETLKLYMTAYLDGKEVIEKEDLHEDISELAGVESSNLNKGGEDDDLPF